VRSRTCGRPEFLSHPHKVSQRCGAHLLHRLAAVQLDGHLAGAKLARNLFI
jgi:hypothetical protein